MSVSDPPEDDGANPRDEPFLARWSRRKRAPEPLPPAPAVPAPKAEAEPDARPRDPETGEAIDQELVAALPDIAALQPGADLSAFMRKGVPEALRRQALRALWESDPAIRDFVSPALDYAHDYNTAGAAHGFGALSESDMAQARQFMTEVFTPAPAETPPSLSAQGAQNCDIESQDDPKMEPVATRRSDVALQRDQAPAADDAGDAAAANLPLHANEAEKAQAEAGQAVVHRSIIDEADTSLQPSGQGAAALRRRRGGGASPA